MTRQTMTTTEAVERTAVLDDTGRYRYVLGRTWPTGAGVATFVMLNPSTADHEVDDPTIRRVVGFARAWGLAGVRVLNLYAYRTPKPAVLWQAERDGVDVVGPRNDEILERHARAACTGLGPFVVAWGAGAKPDRIERVLAIPGVRVVAKALDVTAAGHPRHPLYLPGTSTLTRWEPRA